MSDGAGMQRATSDGVLHERAVPDDDLASAIAAETARGTGQIPIGPDARGAEPGKGDDPDPQQPETGAHSASDPPRSFGSHRAPGAGQQPPVAGRPHGRRVAERVPRVRSATSPIPVPEEGPDGAAPSRVADLDLQAGNSPGSGAAVLPGSAGRTQEPTGRTETETGTSLPMRPAPRPEPAGPALVWAPDDPFVEAPRPRGRSSFIPPSPPSPPSPPVVEGHHLPGPRDPTGRDGEAVPAAGATGGRAEPAANEPAVESERPAPDRPVPSTPVGRQPVRVEPFDDGLPSTVAMPVQRATSLRAPEPVALAPRDLPDRPEAAPTAVEDAAGGRSPARVDPAGPAPVRRRDRRTATAADVSPERRAGLWGTLLVWSGSLATPLAVVLGFAIGGAGASFLAPVLLVAALLPVLPAVLRITSTASRTGAGTAGIARALLGARAGTTVALFLLAVRVLVLSEVLLGIGFVVGAFAPVLAGGPVRPAELPAIAAIVIAGLLAVASTVWRPRVSGVVLVAFAVVALIVTTILLVLLPPGAAPSTSFGPGDLAAALAGFVGVGLVLVLNAAEVARLRARRGPAAGASIGVLGGVLVAVVVLTVSIQVGRSLATTADASAASFVSRLLTGAGPGGVAFLGLPVSLAMQALPVLLLRGAADGAAESLGRRPAAPGAAAVLGLAATAIAVVLISTGASVVSTAALLIPLVGVPVAAWAGLIAGTSSSMDTVGRSPRTAQAVSVAAVVGGTVVGWASVGVAVLVRVPGAFLAVVLALVVGAVGGLVAAAVAGRTASATAGAAPAGDVAGGSGSRAPEAHE